jgi:hypothetical protein
MKDAAHYAQGLHRPVPPARPSSKHDSRTAYLGRTLWTDNRCQASQGAIWSSCPLYLYTATYRVSPSQQIISRIDWGA